MLPRGWEQSVYNTQWWQSELTSFQTFVYLISKTLSCYFHSPWRLAFLFSLLPAWLCLWLLPTGDSPMEGMEMRIMTLSLMYMTTTEMARLMVHIIVHIIMASILVAMDILDMDSAGKRENIVKAHHIQIG